MKEIDVHYWIKNVESPQVRGILILELLDLMDGSYQEREWIEKDKEEYVKNDNKNIRFDANFSFPAELFEDLCLKECITGEEVIDGHIGYSLKTKEEAEVLYKFAETFYKFKADVYNEHQGDSRPTNQEYLSSPYLEPMRKAAGEAFKVFMENEKDNKEFCEFIAGLQEERKQQSK
ncbi:hypothetical protein N3Z17_02435 [Candidatus Bandiella numerosa]|uniref:hypothetical protein n=1 Tax=Candidatus Bandiella numerosa TaxID=2570586 RepID=UPI00249EE9D2|nr:hypothetical protein [Candidatus Bandiella numerosa]WHA05387.1 hypothetical protein N3Z17_02435 [Candidatus Bandiella numerosa]